MSYLSLAWKIKKRHYNAKYSLRDEKLTRQQSAPIINPPHGKIRMILLDAYYTQLEQDALLHITGPDSLSFLQGQTTCDTRNIDETHAQIGSYCTPQGRVVCDFLLCQLHDNHYALRMRRNILASSATRFGKYIVFSKAELDTDNADWQVFACWGNNARSQMQDLFDSAPEAQFACVSSKDYLLVQLDSAGLQYECYLNTRANPELGAKLKAAFTEKDESEWQALQISAGVARIEAATVESFIPQMINYDLTGHISFDKGCYTGQEVVARLHYRGTSKRRMYLAELHAEATTGAGDSLYCPGTEQSAGTVVNAVASPPGSMLALVVATTAGVETGLHVGAANGPALTLGELPYSLDKP